MERYLKQTGVHDTRKSVLLADIGMYGSIVPNLERILPGVEPHYLISKNRWIPGYISTPDHTMPAFERVSGNPAVHFMEDTFSGPIASPSGLLEVDGELVPNTADSSYPAAEALKRKYALLALSDHAETIKTPPSQVENSHAIARLNDFLANKDNYARLMVPHA